jgi:hypothetical protein
VAVTEQVRMSFAEYATVVQKVHLKSEASTGNLRPSERASRCQTAGFAFRASVIDNSAEYEPLNCENHAIGA